MNFQSQNQFVSIAVALAITFFSLIQQVGVVPIGMSEFEFAQAAGLESEKFNLDSVPNQTLPPLASMAGTSLIATAPPVNASSVSVNQLPACVKHPLSTFCSVLVTAYSSTYDQTDHTPFVTASGARVREGIVAVNFLPFGTKLKFPSLYGDRVFIVEDRLARKNSHKVDIWFPNRTEALEFGIKWTMAEILQ